MERQDAIRLLKEYVKNERMLAHCLASEAVMRAMARRLGQNEEKWGLAGLLHDLDVEITQADPHIHAMETARILTEKGFDPAIVQAIMLHNEDAQHQQARNEIFHHALAAGETITGLITATALVYTDKSIHSVKAKSIAKRMKEKAFAASVKRENIMECEKAGIPLNEFIELALEAMQQLPKQQNNC